MKSYGKELILDLHNCDPSTFTRENLRRYFKELCYLINMKRASLYWWDDYGQPTEKHQIEPHLKGTSAVQFILTSNITVHTLDLLGKVFINIFSCKSFNSKRAANFSVGWFGGEVVNMKTIRRM